MSICAFMNPLENQHTLTFKPQYFILKFSRMQFDSKFNHQKRLTFLMILDAIKSPRRTADIFSVVFQMSFYIFSSVSNVTKKQACKVILTVFILSKDARSNCVRGCVVIKR